MSIILLYVAAAVVGLLITVPAVVITAWAENILCQPGIILPCDGTNTDGFITGTEGPDVVNGYGGALDTIWSLDGNDEVYGEDGS